MAAMRLVIIVALLTSRGDANQIRVSFRSSPKIVNITIPDNVDPDQGMALHIKIVDPNEMEGEGLKNDSVEKSPASESGNFHVSASVGTGAIKEWLEVVSGAANGTLPLCFHSKNLKSVKHIKVTSSSDLTTNRIVRFSVRKYDCDGYVTAVQNKDSSPSSTWVIVVIIPILIGVLVLLSIIVVIFYFGFFKKRTKDELEGNPRGNCCECACDCCCPLLRRKKKLKRCYSQRIEENNEVITQVNETPKSMQSMQTPLDQSVEVLPLTSAENTPEKKSQSLESSTVALSPIKVVIPTHVPPTGPIVTPLLQKSIFYKAIQSSPANTNLLDLNRAKKTVPVVLTQKSPQELNRISGDFSQHNIVETMVEKIEKENSPAKISVHPKTPDSKEPFRIIQNPLDVEPLVKMEKEKIGTEPTMVTPDLPPKMSGLNAPNLPPKQAVIEKEPSPELPPKTKSNEKEKEEQKMDSSTKMAPSQSSQYGGKISHNLSSPRNTIHEENESSSPEIQKSPSSLPSSKESDSPKETISTNPTVVDQIYQEKVESNKESNAISPNPSTDDLSPMKNESPNEITPLKLESPTDIKTICGISPDPFYSQLTPEREVSPVGTKYISPILPTSYISTKEESPTKVETISSVQSIGHISDKDESPTEIRNISPIQSNLINEKEESPSEINLISPVLSTSEIMEKEESPIEIKPVSPILSPSQISSEKDESPKSIYSNSSSTWKPPEKEKSPQEQIKMYVPDETGQAIRSRLLPAPLTPEEVTSDPAIIHSPELVSPLSTEASGSPQDKVLNLVDLPPPSMVSEDPLGFSAEPLQIMSPESFMKEPPMVLSDFPPPVDTSSPQRTPDLSSSSYSNESHEDDEVTTKEPQQKHSTNIPDLSPVLPNPEEKTLKADLLTTQESDLSPILPPPDLSSSSSSEEGGDDDDDEKDDEEDEEEGDEDDKEGKETETEKEEDEDDSEENEDGSDDEEDDEDDNGSDGNHPTKDIPTSTDLGLEPTMDELASMMEEAKANELENCIPKKQTGEKIREVDPIEIEQLVNVMGRTNLEEAMLTEERVTLEESTKPEESSSTKSDESQELSPTNPNHATYRNAPPSMSTVDEELRE